MTEEENKKEKREGSELSDMDDEESQLLYIMVVGFHHKKGCQLEFVYPTDDRRIQRLSAANSCSSGGMDESAGGNSGGNGGNGDLYKLPKRWRHLPSLALPDGSHNYTTDYVFFHLEDDNDENEDDADHGQRKENSNDCLVVDANGNDVKTSLDVEKRSRSTVFGVSCYRQINASEMLIKEVA